MINRDHAGRMLVCTCWDLRAGNMMWAISVSRLFRMLPSLQSNTPKFTSCKCSGCYTGRFRLVPISAFHCPHMNSDNKAKLLTCCMLAVLMALSVVLRKNRHFPTKGWKHKRRLCLVLNGKDRGFDTVSREIIYGFNTLKLHWKVLSWTHKDSNQAVSLKS